MEDGWLKCKLVLEMVTWFKYYILQHLLWYSVSFNVSSKHNRYRYKTTRSFCNGMYWIQNHQGSLIVECTINTNRSCLTLITWFLWCHYKIFNNKFPFFNGICPLSLNDSIVWNCKSKTRKLMYTWNRSWLQIGFTRLWAFYYAKTLCL